jgi:regulator of protease activity HflC (stomatin/prohibitin superfamily)
MAEAEFNYAWIALLILAAIAAAPIVFAFKVVPEHQRYIIERMGRYSRVCGQERHFIAPFIDRAIVDDLKATLPGWQRMTEREIEAKITRQRYGAESA